MSTVPVVVAPRGFGRTARRDAWWVTPGVQFLVLSSFVVYATTRIDRTDFGLTAARGMAGRHLDISLRIQGVPR